MDTRMVLGVPGLFLRSVEGKAVQGKLESHEQHLEGDVGGPAVGLGMLHLALVPGKVG